MIDDRKKLDTVEPYRADRAEVFEDFFREADKDKDGLLNEEEYRALTLRLHTDGVERYGADLLLDEEETKKWYDITNSITTGIEGVSIQDYDKFKFIGRVAMAEASNELIQDIRSRISEEERKAFTKVFNETIRKLEELPGEVVKKKMQLVEDVVFRVEYIDDMEKIF